MSEPENKCMNCLHCTDESDGPEYGPAFYGCDKKPHMGNLISFPFKTPQKCFELHWVFKVDWEAETKKFKETLIK